MRHTTSTTSSATSFAPLTLAVFYECFSWRDTWDDLVEEYFDDPVVR